MKLYALKKKENMNFNTHILETEYGFSPQFAKIYSVESVLGEMLVRYAIKTECGILIQKQMFERNNLGKPIMSCGTKKFNISHSGKWILCAISDNEVGIDIERNSRVNLRIAKKYFHEVEKLYIFQNNELKEKRFIEIWTRKESYLKALGIGLRGCLNDFCVVPQGTLITKENRTFCILTTDKIAEYTISVCQEGYINESTIEIVTMDEFEKIIKWR